MPRHARLLLVERILALGKEASEAKLGDLNMLVLTGGCERTEADYARLLQAAGLELTAVVPTRSAMSILEARYPS
jgi:hypothetical protein